MVFDQVTCSIILFFFSPIIIFLLGANIVIWFENGRIFKELKRIGYDDTMTIEVFSRDRDYLKMSREKVAQMWRAA